MVRKLTRVHRHGHHHGHHLYHHGHQGRRVRHRGLQGDHGLRRLCHQELHVHREHLYHQEHRLFLCRRTLLIYIGKVKN